MAKMTTHPGVLLLLVGLIAFGRSRPVAAAGTTPKNSPAPATPTYPPEMPDAHAAKAFKEYWHAFEAYEAKLLKEGEEQYKRQWSEVRANYQKARGEVDGERLAALRRAESRYRQHLADHPKETNRPFVLLDLAQILNLIADASQKSDHSGAMNYRTHALATLRDLATDYPDFVYRDQALYLRAVILEALDQDDEALAAWKTLASSARSTLYGVHARVAVGDHYFKRETPREAMIAYQEALQTLPAVHADDEEYERLRINYRLAWAAYRATELDVTVKAAKALLEPGIRIRSRDERRKIEQDAVDLIGDALFEADQGGKTRAFLRTRDLIDHAGAIGIRMLSRYSAKAAYSVAAELGEFLAENLPLCREYPEILQSLADAHDKLGHLPRRLVALERLALLLPAQSLWRARYRGEPAALRKMEALAGAAATSVATAHYDAGMASGSAKEFQAAAAFYDLLIEHLPNVDAATTWRLRRAHCRYFAGDVDEAASLYASLKVGHKVDPETLQIASYQLVLAHERRWRMAFAKAQEQGINPVAAPSVLAAVVDLEKAADEFAARFPGQSRAVDLLLVAASTNRDMERFEPASRYSQRVLLSQPSPAQRAIAIRGIIVATLKTGSPGDVVELTRRFLKLEDLSALGSAVTNELRGVLATAALDEGRRLSGQGQVREAGTLMTQVAVEFADVPNRDRLWRDGAYMLAIAGEWAEAQQAAEGYLRSGLTKSRGDMTYLLARAHEYQLSLGEAARFYLELGRQSPPHSRGFASLVRAERLAVAEGDHALAAAAAAAQAEQAPKEPQRLAAFTRAVSESLAAGDPNGALALARRRQRISRTPAERLRSELLVQRATAATGAAEEAADSLQILAKEIERSRGKLAAEDYAALVGEVHLGLGDEARQKFEDFRIAERSGNATDNITAKTNMFDELATHYDRVAATAPPRFATEARFRLAAAAEALADEIAAIPSRTDETLTARAQSRYQATIERLKTLARKYYSSNVLAARRDPARYRGNDWVKKSALRLTDERSADPDQRHREALPIAMPTQLPSSWSL